jgi:hypothetical protein
MPPHTTPTRPIDLRRWAAGTCLAIGVCLALGHALGPADLEHRHEAGGGDVQAHRHVHAGPHRHPGSDSDARQNAAAPRSARANSDRSIAARELLDDGPGGRYLAAQGSGHARWPAALATFTHPDPPLTLPCSERPAPPRTPHRTGSSPRGPPA